ncbi:hypothetical protein CAPTEDRAFT_216611 [Capitella teleta]|uniref:Globin domain-containing protein n=1 Tax=Capitella teleta TaxID=283909 RepID=R7UDX7_CAPTE|nr:hypothetical protein CAPTEDRAFT_216611 [Capitella teleta]|eukprot:ELU01973.1 hypothetical protein CAPTEDRAFT_216611 [Capitella teleta]
MGLTTAQRAAIQNNWATVNANMQEMGDALFMRYLLANPGDIQFFPKFASAGVGAQLRSNEAFQEQTLTVFQFLGQIVAKLADLDAAGKMLQERVHSHKPRGITMAQFERLLDLLPRFLQENAGAHGPCADAWRVAIANLMPYMRSEFKKC